jgi:hypothetical protein
VCRHSGSAALLCTHNESLERTYGSLPQSQIIAERQAGPSDAALAELAPGETLEVGLSIGPAPASSCILRLALIVFAMCVAILVVDLISHHLDHRQQYVSSWCIGGLAVFSCSTMRSLLDHRAGQPGAGSRLLCIAQPTKRSAAST